MELTDKVAVVTGAASGIGRAMVQRFGEAGAKLVLADIEAEPLAVAEQELGAAGFDVTSMLCDVSDHAQVKALAAHAVDHFGKVNVIANNAGVGNGGNSWEIPISDWEWVLGVNLWGVIYGVETFVPLLIEAGEGHVVNTASAAGLTSTPFMGPYNVAKHGVVTLSETLFHELAMAHPAIGVSVLCPGWVNTSIAQSGRNRPSGTADSVSDTGVAGLVAGLTANGLDPRDVADRVIKAVTEREFYILTHPEWNAGITERAQNIVDEADPVMRLPEN